MQTQAPEVDECSPGAGTEALDPTSTGGNPSASGATRTTFNSDSSRGRAGGGSEGVRWGWSAPEQQRRNRSSVDESFPAAAATADPSPAAAPSASRRDDDESVDSATPAAKPWSAWRMGAGAMSTARRRGNKNDAQASVANKTPGDITLKKQKVGISTTSSESAVEDSGMLPPPPPPPLARARSRVQLAAGVGSSSIATAGVRGVSDRASPRRTYAARSPGSIRSPRVDSLSNIRTSRQKTPQGSGTIANNRGLGIAAKGFPQSETIRNSRRRHVPPRATPPRPSPQQVDALSAQYRRTLEIPQMPDFSVAARNKRKVTPTHAGAEPGKGSVGRHGGGGSGSGKSWRASNSSTELAELDTTPFTFRDVVPFTPLDTPEPGSWRTFLSSPAPLLLDPPPLSERRLLGGDEEEKGSLHGRDGEVSAAGAGGDSPVGGNKKTRGISAANKCADDNDSKARSDGKDQEVVGGTGMIKKGSPVAVNVPVKTSKSFFPWAVPAKPGNAPWVAPTESMNSMGREQGEQAAIVTRTGMIDTPRTDIIRNVDALSVVLSVSPTKGGSGGGGRRGGIWTTTPKSSAGSMRQRVPVSPVNQSPKATETPASGTAVFPSPLLEIGTVKALQDSFTVNSATNSSSGNSNNRINKRSMNKRATDAVAAAAMATGAAVGIQNSSVFFSATDKSQSNRQPDKRSATDSRRGLMPKRSRSPARVPVGTTAAASSSSPSREQVLRSDVRDIDGNGIWADDSNEDSDSVGKIAAAAAAEAEEAVYSSSLSLSAADVAPVGDSRGNPRENRNYGTVVHISSLISPLYETPAPLAPASPNAGVGSAALTPAEIERICAAVAIGRKETGLCSVSSVGAREDIENSRSDNSSRRAVAATAVAAGGNGGGGGSTVKLGGGGRAGAWHGGGGMWYSNSAATWTSASMGNSMSNTYSTPSPARQVLPTPPTPMVAAAAAGGGGGAVAAAATTPSLTTEGAQVSDSYIPTATTVAPAGRVSGTPPAVPLRTLLRNAARSTPKRAGAVAEFSAEVLSRCVPLRCVGSDAQVMDRVRDFLESERKVRIENSRVVWGEGGLVSRGCVRK